MAIPRSFRLGKSKKGGDPPSQAPAAPAVPAEDTAKTHSRSKSSELRRRFRMPSGVSLNSKLGASNARKQAMQGGPAAASSSTVDLLNTPQSSAAMGTPSANKSPVAIVPAQPKVLDTDTPAPASRLPASHTAGAAVSGPANAAPSATASALLPSAMDPDTASKARAAGTTVPSKAAAAAPPAAGGVAGPRPGGVDAAPPWPAAADAAVPSWGRATAPVASPLGAPYGTAPGPRSPPAPASLASPGATTAPLSYLQSTVSTPAAEPARGAAQAPLAGTPATPTALRNATAAQPVASHGLSYLQQGTPGANTEDVSRNGAQDAAPRSGAATPVPGAASAMSPPVSPSKSTRTDRSDYGDVESDAHSHVSSFDGTVDSHAMTLPMHDAHEYMDSASVSHTTLAGFVRRPAPAPPASISRMREEDARAGEDEPEREDVSGVARQVDGRTESGDAPVAYPMAHAAGEKLATDSGADEQLATDSDDAGADRAASTVSSTRPSVDASDARDDAPGDDSVTDGDTRRARTTSIFGSVGAIASAGMAMILPKSLSSSAASPGPADTASGDAPEVPPLPESYRVPEMRTGAEDEGDVTTHVADASASAGTLAAEHDRDPVPDEVSEADATETRAAAPAARVSEDLLDTSGAPGEETETASRLRAGVPAAPEPQAEPLTATHAGDADSAATEPDLRAPTATEGNAAFDADTVDEGQEAASTPTVGVAPVEAATAAAPAAGVVQSAPMPPGYSPTSDARDGDAAAEEEEHAVEPTAEDDAAPIPAAATRTAEGPDALAAGADASFARAQAAEPREDELQATEPTPRAQEPSAPSAGGADPGSAAALPQDEEQQIDAAAAQETIGAAAQTEAPTDSPRAADIPAEAEEDAPARVAVQSAAAQGAPPEKGASDKATERRDATSPAHDISEGTAAHVAPATAMGGMTLGGLAAAGIDYLKHPLRTKPEGVDPTRNESRRAPPPAPPVAAPAGPPAPPVAAPAGASPDTASTLPAYLSRSMSQPAGLFAPPVEAGVPPAFAPHGPLYPVAETQPLSIGKGKARAVEQSSVRGGDSGGDRQEATSETWLPRSVTQPEAVHSAVQPDAGYPYGVVQPEAEYSMGQAEADHSVAQRESDYSTAQPDGVRSTAQPDAPVTHAKAPQRATRAAFPAPPPTAATREDEAAVAPQSDGAGTEGAAPETPPASEDAVDSETSMSRSSSRPGAARRKSKRFSFDSSKSHGIFAGTASALGFMSRGKRTGSADVPDTETPPVPPVPSVPQAHSAAQRPQVPQKDPGRASAFRSLSGMTLRDATRSPGHRAGMGADAPSEPAPSVPKMPEVPKAPHMPKISGAYESPKSPRTPKSSKRASREYAHDSPPSAPGEMPSMPPVPKAPSLSTPSPSGAKEQVPPYAADTRAVHAPEAFAREEPAQEEPAPPADAPVTHAPMAPTYAAADTAPEQAGADAHADAVFADAAHAGREAAPPFMPYVHQTAAAPEPLAAHEVRAAANTQGGYAREPVAAAPAQEYGTWDAPRAAADGPVPETAGEQRSVAPEPTWLAAAAAPAGDMDQGIVTESHPRYLHTVSEERGAEAADDGAAAAHQAEADVHVVREDPPVDAASSDREAPRAAPAIPTYPLRGSGAFDPDAIARFMREMDEDDYGRAVARASTMGVSPTDIPSDVPAVEDRAVQTGPTPADEYVDRAPHAAQGAEQSDTALHPDTVAGAMGAPLPAVSEEPRASAAAAYGPSPGTRPSDMFAGKGVRWDSDNWLRSGMVGSSPSSPQTEEFNSFLKARRQFAPTFAGLDTRTKNNPHLGSAPQAPPAHYTPGASIVSAAPGAAARQAETRPVPRGATEAEAASRRLSRVTDEGAPPPPPKDDRKPPLLSNADAEHARLDDKYGRAVEQPRHEPHSARDGLHEFAHAVEQPLQGAPQHDPGSTHEGLHEFVHAVEQPLQGAPQHEPGSTRKGLHEFLHAVEQPLQGAPQHEPGSTREGLHEFAHAVEQPLQGAPQHEPGSTREGLHEFAHAVEQPLQGAPQHEPGTARDGLHEFAHAVEQPLQGAPQHDPGSTRGGMHEPALAVDRPVQGAPPQHVRRSGSAEGVLDRFLSSLEQPVDTHLVDFDELEKAHKQKTGYTPRVNTGAFPPVQNAGPAGSTDIAAPIPGAAQAPASASEAQDPYSHNAYAEGGNEPARLSTATEEPYDSFGGGRPLYEQWTTAPPAENTKPRAYDARQQALFEGQRVRQHEYEMQQRAYDAQQRAYNEQQRALEEQRQAYLTPQQEQRLYEQQQRLYEQQKRAYEAQQRAYEEHQSEQRAYEEQQRVYAEQRHAYEAQQRHAYEAQQKRAYEQHQAEQRAYEQHQAEQRAYEQHHAEQRAYEEQQRAYEAQQRAYQEQQAYYQQHQQAQQRQQQEQAQQRYYQQQAQQQRYYQQQQAQQQQARRQQQQQPARMKSGPAPHAYAAGMPGPSVPAGAPGPPQVVQSVSLAPLHKLDIPSAHEVDPVLADRTRMVQARSDAGDDSLGVFPRGAMSADASRLTSPSAPALASEPSMASYSRRGHRRQTSSGANSKRSSKGWTALLRSDPLAATK
ncbi:hypothetical protein MSPP1_002459 [Malassezia sp. CBS 17886]|nr:hypothetical protein MSPP1_002459 [Malassezia sp. CBS 17886]